MISIEELEHAAAPGWRAIEEDRLGDWLFRAAGGFTGRANSALAAGDPGCPLPAAIGQVRRWYASRDLPPVVAVPFPAGQPAASPLDRLLARCGWTIRPGRATVMVAATSAVAEITATPATATPALVTPALVTPALVTPAMAEFAAEPDAAWLARYHYRGQELPPVAVRLLTSAPWQSFATVRLDGQAIAIGRVAGAGDWAGLTAIEVDPEYRRRGAGAAVTVALAARAAAAGYPRIYLQVTDDNTAARSLYRRLGFTDHHGYHYRVAPD